MVRGLRGVPWKSTFDGLASVVLVVAGVMVIWTNITAGGPKPKQLPVPESPLAIDPASTKGSQAAPATLVVFSDFECPYCKRFTREILPSFQRDYIDTGTAGTPVFDETGMKGAFDIEMTFRAPRPGTAVARRSGDDGLPSLADSLRDDLGLKMDNERRSVSFLVVEQVEQPTEN